MKRTSLLLVTIVLATLFGCESSETKPPVADPAGTTQDLSADEAKAIAKEAYLYGLPMVMNYKTMWNYSVDKDSRVTGPRVGVFQSNQEPRLINSARVRKVESKHTSPSLWATS